MCTVEYDWDGLDQAAFNSWDRSLSPLTPTDEERKNLQDLIPAWESGLDTVIVLPYDGYFANALPAGILQYRLQHGMIPPPIVELYERLPCNWSRLRFPSGANRRLASHLK